MKLKDLDVKGKRVLLRVDFNVPLDEQQNIVDTTRIDAALPTIRYLLDQGAALIVMSHLGRPKGKYDERYSLAPCADYLKRQLPYPIIMASDCIGLKTKAQVRALRPGELLLLENLRFHSAEEKTESDPSFAQTLASYGELYVNDAFGTAHRKHSSTYSVAQAFPQKCAAGFLLEKEIQFLGETLKNPKRPFYALVGGAKISSKLAVLHSLLEKVDALFIGGAMAYTFMASQKMSIGNSLFEPELLDEAKKIIEKAKKKAIPIFLPLDFVVVQPKGQSLLRNTGEPWEADEEGVDIGPKTIAFYKEKLKEAKTLFWNGPFGKYETEPYDQGTLAILRQVSELNAITILGGGDLVAASAKAHVADKVTHISTGGGATLEYIEKGSLPAIEALSKQNFSFL